MKNDQGKAEEIFRKGGIVIFPTDTAIGIGCRMDDVDAINKIYEIRNRPSEKPLLILVSSFEMAEKYILPVSLKCRELMKKYWPGGVTFILPANTERVPSVVRAGRKTIAIRFPENKEVVGVIEKLGIPIVAPSANITGEKTPLEINEVDVKIKRKVDFILPGVCTMKGVSTIIDLTTNPFQVVRHGVVTIDDEDFVS